MFDAELIQGLRAAERIVVLTGAGVSQESGLRTFRDPQDGYWAKFRPEDLATPEAFERDPRLVWEWYAFRRRQVAEVHPNPGHYALSEFGRRLSGFTLITQNVDGLHQRSGSRDVIELHGNLTRVRCSVCRTVARDWVDHPRVVPSCAECAGLLRPDVVWFGEPLPEAALQMATQAARNCDFFFSIGTSGVVEPAASLARLAKNHGGVVIEINQDATPLTRDCDFSFCGKSGEWLPRLVDAVCGGG